MEIWRRHAQQIQGRVDAMKVSYTKLEALQAEVAVSRSARLDYLYILSECMIGHLKDFYI